MLCTESGILIAVKELQLEKAYQPIFFTEEGISIFVNELQKENAES